MPQRERKGHRNPETYLGTARARYYANPGSKYVTGVQTFEEVEKPDRYFYTLGGTWNLKSDSITPAASEGASLTLNFRAAVVQLVASGHGVLKVTYPDGSTKDIPVPDVPGSIDLIRGDSAQEGLLNVSVPEGVEMYSMTFG